MRAGRHRLVRWTVTALVAATGCRRSPNVTGVTPLRQEAYVWQRVWNASVREAVAKRTASFASITVLAAEMSWRGNRFEIARARIDAATLRLAQCPVGIALRIGPYGGPFDATNVVAAVSDCAAETVRGFAAAGVKPFELQIDFDCAESKLDGYRLWVDAIRERVAPVPVVVTALPSWLNQTSCRRLVSAADGFVLQVHSLQRPEQFEQDITLCDPAAARRAVARADRLGRDFRVALPTYGYRLAFGPDGRFAGIAAENRGAFPPGVRVRVVRSDPDRIAGLVREWRARRPAHLCGVIWYRLPVAGDELNWPWPTLASVMKGAPPAARLTASATQTQPGLVDVRVYNDGTADVVKNVGVTLTWSGARFIAGDGLNGFVLRQEKAGRFILDRGADMAQPISVGSRVQAAWLRFEGPVEMRCEVAH